MLLNLPQRFAQLTPEEAVILKRYSRAVLEPLLIGAKAKPR